MKYTYKYAWIIYLFLFPVTMLIGFFYFISTLFLKNNGDFTSSSVSL
uniref:NADH dehydrogenase subunit 5 n=1 Tax=Lankesterella ceracifolia TaxID=683362 RepID=A0A6G8J263_9ASPA|nr:NADH dehydrogenase subunit 5 [Lankesterella ceracifolia]QIM61231.1 NADH dehydrogenase subunit 5 [Lankesterella ceracifolia]